MRKLFLLPLVCLAAACQTTGSLSGIPEERIVCPDEPDAPAGLGPNGAVTDDENNEYLRRLRGAYLGCKEDIQWIRDYLDR